MVEILRTWLAAEQLSFDPFSDACNNDATPPPLANPDNRLSLCYSFQILRHIPFFNNRNTSQTLPGFTQKFATGTLIYLIPRPRLHTSAHMNEPASPTTPKPNMSIFITFFAVSPNGEYRSLM
jgi:hypothetical protein